MSTETVPDRSNGQTIDQTWYNLLKSIIGGNFVPRNASGVATADGGTLGDSTYTWMRAYITTGYWSLGDIKLHHSYNGAAPIGHGWMLCDGRQVTSATYNTEHGANTFATYIVSTPFLNLFLPNFTSRYPVGKAATTQDGSIAITAVGNVSNTSNLSHAHTVAHNHQYYHDVGSGGTGRTYDSSGAETNVSNAVSSGPNLACTGTATNITRMGDSYTKTATPTTSTDLASANIQPDSIEVQYYMRII